MKRWILAAAFVVGTPLAWSPAPVVADNGAHAHATDDAHATDHADEHGGGHHGFDVGNLYWSLLNFLIFVLLLMTAGRKPLSEFLTNRRSQVEEAIAEATQLREAAEAKYNEYAERLARLDDELDSIRSEMVSAGEAERERMIADAERKAAHMREEVRWLVEQEAKSLRHSLMAEAVDAAIEAATRALRDKLSSDDQFRLAQTYLDELAVKVNEERPS